MNHDGAIPRQADAIMKTVMNVPCGCPDVADVWQSMAVFLVKCKAQRDGAVGMGETGDNAIWKRIHVCMHACIHAQGHCTAFAIFHPYGFFGLLFFVAPALPLCLRRPHTPCSMVGMVSCLGLPAPQTPCGDNNTGCVVWLWCSVTGAQEDVHIVDMGPVRPRAALRGL